MRLLLLSIALLLGGCVTYPDPYAYDDPYYQSSTAYNGAYDDQYYAREDSVGYTGGHFGAYDVSNSYDPWFRMYWGWDYYGYAPYRHNHYSSYYGYGYVPFHRPYYGYGWSAWDYLWWPSAYHGSGYGYGYNSWPSYGGWYGSGYYWHPHDRRDDHDDHRSARQAAREIRPGVPATHSSRPGAVGQSYRGQSFGNRGYGGQAYGGQSYGGQSYGNSSGRYTPQAPNSVRGAARSIAPQGDAGRPLRNFAPPPSRPSDGSSAPSRPSYRGRSASDVPTGNYPSSSRDRSAGAAEPRRSRGYLREDSWGQGASPAARSSGAAHGATSRPPASSYRAPSRPSSTAPAAAPRARSWSGGSSVGSAPSARSAAPSASGYERSAAPSARNYERSAAPSASGYERSAAPSASGSDRSSAPSASGGSARSAIRGRNEQDD